MHYLKTTIQHRIVAKVDELMTLCEQLKNKLNEAQTTQVQLADAIVEKTLQIQINEQENHNQDEYS